MRKVKLNENGLTEKAQASLDKVVKAFETGNINEAIKMSRFTMPEGTPAATWSFLNQLLVYAQTDYKTIDARTVKAWNAAGYKLKAGCKAVYIMQPTFRKIEVEDKKTGEKVEKNIYRGTVPSHRISAVDVEPFHPENPNSFKPLPEPEARTPLALEKLATELGVEINYVHVPADRLGDCDNSGTRVNLGTDDISVLAHELAHAVHAKLGWKDGESKVNREVVADVIGATLAGMYGFDYSGRSYQYLKNYTDNPYQATMACMDVISECLKFIFGLIEVEDIETEKITA